VFGTAALAALAKGLELRYGNNERSCADPELAIRMLIVGCCYGTHSERKLTRKPEQQSVDYRFRSIVV
jgi:hypothetical protein